MSLLRVGHAGSCSTHDGALPAIRGMKARGAGHYLAPWLAVAALLILAPTLLGGCGWPTFGGPDWHQRRLILVPGVCMDAAHLPPPPPLPLGLPQLPSRVQLPDWLACGPGDQPINARDRARATFGALISTLEHPANNRQVFHDGDVRYFSFDATSSTFYVPSATRQSLESSAAGLEQEFQAWHHAEPRATFDVAGHSLGGVIALLWAAKYASRDELSYVHAIVTLDSPVAGYPQPLFSYVEPYLVPLFGAIGRELASDASMLQEEARAPARWKRGAGPYTNAVYDMSNIRDLVVPAFVATLSGADGIIDDFGKGPDTLNHGAVIRSPKALATASAVLQTTDGPQLV